MPLPPVLSSIVGWLRAGYPDGVPANDYVPLLALLARRLTGEEVAAVAAELARQTGGTGTQQGSAAVDSSDIGVQITKVTNEMPREEDIERVRAHLSASGPFL